MLRAMLALGLALICCPAAQAGVVWQSESLDKNVSSTTMQTLQNAASSLSFNVVISSGGRDPDRNASTSGSASNSSHLRGTAFDISTKGLTFDQKQELTGALLKSGFGGIGFYGEDGHIHVDTEGTRTWGAQPSWAQQPMAQLYGKVDRTQTSGDPAKQTNPDGSKSTGGVLDTVSNGIQSIVGSGGDKLQEIVASLKQTCWSCEVYSRVHGGVSMLMSDTFKYLTRTPEIAGVLALILMIALGFKILKVIGTPFTPSVGAEWSRIYGFLARIAFVFLFLFGIGAVEAMSGDTTQGEGVNPIRFIFIDFPVGVGTEIGCQFIKIASSAGSGGSTIAANCEGAGNAGLGLAGGAEQTMMSKHREQAVAILRGIHEMSIQVVSIGIWLATEAPFKVGAGGLTAFFAVGAAGIALVAMFFWFSISFGFRYIDALVRTTIAAVFLPVYLYLWIFDNQRSRAVEAIKMLAYVGAVFAASGIVFVIADQIMCLGLSSALGGSCKSVASAASSGGFDKLIGNNGVQWSAIFILVGTGGLVVKLAGTVFSVANILISSDVDTGAGAGAESAMRSGMGSLVPGMKR